MTPVLAITCAMVLVLLRPRTEIDDDARAWPLFLRGTELLEGGSPRPEVLVPWEEALRHYPRSRYHDQLLDYAATLKEQLDQEAKLAAHTVGDPRALPIDQRIAYFIARFPDVHGKQMSQPGKCLTVFGRPRPDTGTWPSDSIVEIGRSAIPALIEHLDDRRLTRSVGFRRKMNHERTVLRVQDVAYECIERILDTNFDGPGARQYFSLATREFRESNRSNIQTWWAENSAKSPLDSQLANLRRQYLHHRFDALRKVERMDSKAVDSVALLKRWAATATNEELAFIAVQLGERCDLSLLPAMREMAREGDQEIPDDCVSFLSARGVAEDIRLLLRGAQAQLRASTKPGSTPRYGRVFSNIRSSRNAVAVPVLVEFLGDRDTIGRNPDGLGFDSNIAFSFADLCYLALVQLTNHNEGYVSFDPAEKRFAAIDQWLAWWREQGEAAFLDKHPEVRKPVSSDKDCRL